MELIDKLFSIFAPYSCVVCGEDGAIACEGCLISELVTVPGGCMGCKRLSRGYETCSKCIASFPLSALWVACEYSPLAKTLVSAYKYNSQRAASDIFAGRMLEVCPRVECVVTCIPTAPSRIRQRGFDHTARIAKKIAIKRQLPYYNMLRRMKKSHQVGSGREKRIKQTEGLFAMRNSIDIRGKDVLLVDDVVTTGASLSAAAKELKKAGAKNVYGLVFARKM